MCKKSSIDYQKTVEDNLRLVHLFVNKLNYGYVDKEDLYQAGLMGLFFAAKHFDEKKGVKFTTFASFYIISEIKKELRENKLIKYSKKIYHIKRELNNINEFSQIENIIEKNNINKEIVYDLYINENKLNVSLDDEIINKYESNNNKNIFMYAKECLSGIFYDVIKMKYINSLSQEAIGKLLGLSQSKISRIEKISLKKLKKYYLDYNNSS